MTNQTPVLIWADLPIDLRMTDEERPEIKPYPMPKGRHRCQARSRGDSYIAMKRGVPVNGGWRCRYPAHSAGLCGLHWRKATPAVRNRAAELSGQGGTP